MCAMCVQLKYVEQADVVVPRKWKESTVVTGCLSV